MVLFKLIILPFLVEVTFGFNDEYLKLFLTRKLIFVPDELKIALDTVEELVIW